MSALLWLHCNKCFKGHSKSERNFYMTSCDHVLCKVCAKKTHQARKCISCYNATTIEPIDKNMRKEKASLFMNMKKLQDQYRKMVHFQISQIALRNQFILKRYNLAKAACQKSYLTYKNQQIELKRLQDQLNNGRRYRRPLPSMQSSMANTSICRTERDFRGPNKSESNWSRNNSFFNLRAPLNSTKGFPTSRERSMSSLVNHFRDADIKRNNY